MTKKKRIIFCGSGGRESCWRIKTPSLHHFQDTIDDETYSEEELLKLLKELRLEECPPYQFIFPTNCGLYGMSQSGKSTFIANLIHERKRLFKLENGIEDIHKIFYFYGSTFQLHFESLAREEGVIFVQGLPENINTLFEPEDKGEPMLLIFDDLMNVIQDNPSMFQLVFKDSHHLNLFVVMTFQTLFPQGKFAIRIREQLHVPAIFKLLGEKHGITRRFSGFATKKRVDGLVTFYNNNVMKRTQPGGYIIINNHPKTQDVHLQYCTNIFKKEAPLQALVAK